MRERFITNLWIIAKALWMIMGGLLLIVTSVLYLLPCLFSKSIADKYYSLVKRIMIYKNIQP